MKRAVRFSVRIKDTEKVFDEELGPGVIAMQELIYDEEPEVYESTAFIVNLINTEERFLKETVECVMEEVPVD